MEGLFSRIVADKNAFFKHQQIGEDELTDGEKLEILKKLFSSKISVFLIRYQKYLKPVDCINFADCDDFVVQSIVKQIRGKKEVTEKEKRNIRFNQMQKLLKEGVYFSDAKMREREPYLFDVMIGKFLCEEERMDSIRPTVSRDTSESTWSTVMVRLEDSAEIAERRNLQEMECEGLQNNKGGRDHISRFMSHVENHADSFVPEEEDDEVDNEIEKMRREMERLSKIEADHYCCDMGEDDTQEILRQEFEAFMQQKFLAGKDKEFYDYSNCEESLFPDPIRERDDEERWFGDDD